MAVNTSHPIGEKVRWALFPTDSLNEQISGVAPAGTIGTTESLPEGVAYIPASSATTWATGDVPIDPHDNDISIVWYGAVNTSGARTILAQYIRNYGWMVRAEMSGGVVYLRLYTYWGGGIASATINTFFDNSVHHLGIRFTKSASTIDFFVDGALHTGGVTWAPLPTEDITPPATFYMQNEFSVWKCITCQVYEGALSDVEFATLASDPFAIFSAPPISLTVPGITQSNTASNITIGLSGSYYADSLIQTNTLSSGNVARVQDLTVSNLSQTNSLANASINPHKRLRDLADAAPLYTWFKVNTTRYVDCQMPVGDRPFNFPGQYDHVKIIHPWSSFAYDYDQGRILLWGGGHANYMGNQLYIWDGRTGEWELACLPSAVDSNPNTRFIVDSKAPQSSHTYHNNVWLKENNMFCTFGGAATPSGGPPLEYASSEDEDFAGVGYRRVSPWLYDLTKTDPEKVGGSDGSGMNPARLGLNAWQHRRDNVPTGEWNTDAYPITKGGHASQAAISIHRDGKDYVIFTMDGNSGFPAWYRWEFGDVRLGEDDQCIYLGKAGGHHITEGWMVHDTTRDLVYRNAYAFGASPPAELVTKDPWVTGTTNADAGVRLVHSGSGDPFLMQKSEVSQECPYGAAYDETNDCIWLWSGVLPDTGVIYRINIPAYDTTTGWESTTWTVDTVVPQGTRPYGQHATPLLGKLKYVPEVGALITLDSPSNDGTRDADVWMFKTAQLAAAQLEGDSSTQSNSTSTGSIAIEKNIVMENAAQTNQMSVGAVGITGHIVASNVSQVNAISDAAIIIILEVVGDNLAQTNSANTDGITQTHIIVSGVVTQTNTASVGSINIQGNNFLAVASPTQTNNISSAEITVEGLALNLAIASAIQSNLSPTGAISQEHNLSASNILQTNSVSESVIYFSVNNLSGDNTSQANNLLSGSITFTQTLSAESLVNSASISGGTVTVTDGPPLELKVNPRYVAYWYGGSSAAAGDEIGSKDQREEVTITFDYSVIDQPISSGSVSIKVTSGIDKNPSNMLNGAPQVHADKDKVLQRIIGGNQGCVYKVTCLATIGSDKLLSEYILYIRRRCESD